MFQKIDFLKLSCTNMKEMPRAWEDTLNFIIVIFLPFGFPFSRIAAETTQRFLSYFLLYWLEQWVWIELQEPVEHCYAVCAQFDLMLSYLKLAEVKGKERKKKEIFKNN